MIYLDNSATTFPKPNVVYRFMTNFYRKHGVNPGRSGFDAALETEEIVYNTRKLLTELFNGGGDPNRLTFSYNATDSLNMWSPACWNTIPCFVRSTACSSRV